jgi:hypothetical protein
MPKAAKAVPTFLLVISIGLLVLFLWWHWHLGLVRYFDADEFAHLHWAAKMLEGKRPFIDFQTFFPPGFAISLMPTLLFGWGTSQPFITARILTFFIFLGLCFVSGIIFWQQRKSRWGAVLAMAFLAFIPLPFDKYLEVRPDNLATLLILIAVYAELKWMTQTPQIKSSLPAGKVGLSLEIYPLLSGLGYSLSYLVLPKTLPNIGVGILIAIFYIWDIREIKNKRIQWGKLKSIILPFVAGLGIPLVIFGIWVLTLGDLSLVWYSLFTLPVEANKISKYFIMMQDLFFYPNSIYYGVDGWSRGLYVNIIFWVVGFLVGSYRLITPFLTSQGEKPKAMGELLIALQFWIQIAFFVEYVPLKHPQYLIPIGVFIAWYNADLILSIWNGIKSIFVLRIVFLIIFFILGIFLHDVFMEINSPKINWTNKSLLDESESMYQIVPKNEYVLDLVGQMLYNPDPYYACCIPFGQSMEFMSRPLPDLPTVLEKTNTKYIAQGGLARVNTLPWNWQMYIGSRFIPYRGDKSLLVRKDVVQ